MMERVILILCSFVTFCLFLRSSAKRVDGFLDTRHTVGKADWKFLTRFCFLDSGTVSYNFFYPVSHGTLSILFYNDKIWPKVYPTQKTCSAKLAILNHRSNQILRLKMGASSGCYQVKVLGNAKSMPQYYWNCSGTRMFSTRRDMWWFIVVAKCHTYGDKGLVLKYSLHLTNAKPFEKLYYEFSADEFNILPTDVAFLLIHIIMCGISLYFSAILKKRQLFHSTFKMFIMAVFLWMFHLFLLTMAYAKYAYTGRSVRGVKAVARVVSSASEVVFLLVVLLMGSGLTITRGRLRPFENMLLLAFMSGYVFVLTMLLIWQQTMFDEGLVLYIYESDAGYCLVSLRIVGWFIFVYFVYHTYAAYQTKRRFYIRLLLFFTLWFFLTPMMILISNLVIPVWMREKTVNGIELFIGALGHCFFLILTNPAIANTNFPFHVKTTQIGFLDVPPDAEGPSDAKYSLDRAPDFTALFTVSQSRSKRAEPSVVQEAPAREKTLVASAGDHSGDSLLTHERRRDDSDTNDAHMHRTQAHMPNYNMFQVTGK